jgi:hypothetical protein
MGKKKNAYMVLVRRPVRKRELVNCKCGWEEDVRADFEKTWGGHGLNFSGSACRQAVDWCGEILAKE